MQRGRIGKAVAALPWWMRVVGGAGVLAAGFLWWGGVDGGGAQRPDVVSDDATEPTPRDDPTEPTPRDDASGPTPPGGGELEVHFIDAGQGDATLFLAPDATVLVDAGRHTATDVVDYLEDKGVSTIDVVAITHPHADHIGQFAAVLERFAVAEVWWSPTTHTTETFASAVTALERSDAAFEEPVESDTADVGSLRFEFVNPPAGGTDGDLHDNGLAFRVTYGGVAFLFTGDAETETEQRIVAAHPDLRAAVYQVGHHGSSSSSSQALLDAVTPEVAIYSAGRDNTYGHPHPEVIDRLHDAGVEVYGTDEHGTVIVTTGGTDVHITTTTDRATGAPRSDDRCARPGDRSVQGLACAG